MLSENIKNLRKAKGLSQEELAVELNVVRQTVSKWEQGLSVPDSDMLLALSEALETPVSALLGETIDQPEADDLKAISEKLEVINHQLANRTESKRKALHWAFIILALVIVSVFAVLMLTGNSYMDWGNADPEHLVLGTFLHAFVWVFVRLAPFALIGAVIGVVLTRRKG